MKKQPPVSVIMTVYNAEKHLEDTLRSVLGQTFDDFEFIIIDDGSSDRSVEIVRGIPDERIRFIPEKHQNYIDLLNKALLLSQGKYMVKMDHDDLMMPTRVEKQYAFMEDHPEIDLCGSWAQTFGSESYVVKTPVGDTEIRSLLLLQSPLVHPSVMLRRSSVDAYLEKKQDEHFYHPAYRYADDYKLWTDLAAAGWRFANLPEVLLKYRLSEQQITHLYRSECKQMSLKVQREYMAAVLSEMLRTPSWVSEMASGLMKIPSGEAIGFEDMQLLVYGLYRCFLKSKI